MPHVRTVPCLVLLMMLALPVQAQVPDSTEAPARDSLQAPPRRAPAGPVLGPPPVEPGEVIVPVLPARLAVTEVTDILARMPGAFLYGFGTSGWPDGWSPYGLPPAEVALLLGGIPFNDLVTGRPRYDLLPLAFLEPPRVGPTRHGAPAAVFAEIRPYDVRQPLTELRYWTGGGGLQAVEALHAQQRRRSLFGREGVLGAALGYIGRAAQGAYPSRAGWGTRLQRERRIYARLRYAQPRWSLTLSNLHNRRGIGAHGGVLPRSPDDFDSVYEPLTANLRNPAAHRQTIRNDLVVEGRRQLLPGAAPPLTLTLYWTAQTARYTDAADTLSVEADRLGLRARQDLVLGSHRAGLYLAAWRDRIGPSTALSDSLGLTRGQFHAAVQDTFSLLGSEAAVEGSLHAGSGAAGLGGAFHLARSFGGLRLFLEGRRAGAPRSVVERYGFGPFVQPLDSLPNGRVTQLRLGTRLQGGAWDLLLFGFSQRRTDAVDLFVLPGQGGAADTVAVRVSSAPVRHIGATAALGWRREARRGLYTDLQATLLGLQNPDASADHARLEASLPPLFGRGRLGARFGLFRGDLDLDLYVQGRFWTRMQSRTLHPATGLLVLPDAGGRTFGPAGTLDVFAEALVVRTATVFLAYENALSGTALTAGTLLVPVYPLPEQRFRFGVYWPITG